MLFYMTHKEKPGVRAPMRNQAAVDLHAADGWVIEETTSDDKDIKDKLISDAKKFGIKLDARKSYAKLLSDYETALEAKNK